MDVRNAIQRPAPAIGADTDHSEEMIAEADEPPDERKHQSFWSPTGLASHSVSYMKAQPPPYARRESLLTRQLHSETEHTEDEDHAQSPLRGLSTTSTSSNPSTTSTAELTSDDGHSLASPAISPPLSPTHTRTALPIMDKPLAKEPRIVSQEAVAGVKQDGTECSVEAGLGRKRCITFACGRKSETKNASPRKEVVVEQAASPPKRKCMLKFVCPTRAGAEAKPAYNGSAQTQRHSSPPPQARASAKAKSDAGRVHRGSDSTVTATSPKATRRTSPTITEIPATPTPVLSRKLSNDSEDEETEATRFREFATTENEEEGWVQESTCHRSRLTINDTLQKENVIRQLGEEAEEEALEEDDLDDEDVEDAAELEDEDDGEAEAEVDEEEEEYEESDAGFRTDDEEGFAESDDDSQGSDTEWWTPGPGRSTAATSTDQLEYLLTRVKSERIASDSSIGSASSGHMSPRSSTAKFHKRARRHRETRAMPILRPDAPELPDSTDFVCGTLDEDRPVEQAYINCMRQREAEKHKPVPQDIDPTFPTSDPDMDEEDDDDLDDAPDSEQDLVHGELEELHGTAKRRPSPRPQRHGNTTHRSPPPPTARRPSPVPKRTSICRSPPPAAARRPSPAPKRRSICHSPPPPAGRRATARSPPPRKLFGQSPTRARSPAPGRRMTSPPNSRRASPNGSPVKTSLAIYGLAERPAQLTHTASLPRGGFLLSNLHPLREAEVEDTDATAGEVHKRGAIDIYKGLEKKRQRRKEKLWQKHCAKAAAKGEKAHKVKPGKGCERMREVGLQLQNYQGKGKHILSM